MRRATKITCRMPIEVAATDYCDIAADIDMCENESQVTTDAVKEICSTVDYEVPLTDDQVDDLSDCVQPEPTPTRTPGPTPTRTPTRTPVPTDTPVPAGSPTPTPTTRPTRTPGPTPEPITDIEQATGNLTYASASYRTAITTTENAD